MKIDGNTGETIKIDDSGMNVKSYHQYVTGFATSTMRTSAAKMIGDQSMIPEIGKKVKLWHPDLCRQTIRETNLDHFLP